MDVYYIDYISVSGASWLHKAPAGLKMVVAAVMIGVLLWLRYIWILSAIFAAVVVIALSARLPIKLLAVLALYPLFFLIIVFLSTAGLNVYSVSMLMLRVLSITEIVILFLLTTSYPTVFGVLGRVLPGVLVAALFFTYRSIFVISQSLSDISIALHLRGGIDWKHPGPSLGNLGRVLGHLLVDTIDSSERKADSLRIRGFVNRVYYLKQ
ncbi:MAG: energy-coupling factor transporter transmembrane component T [Armatimonadota bacterium]